MLWRRIVLLFTAMFLTNYAWIQVIVFVWMAFMSMFFIGYVMPHVERAQNIMELVNEEFVLICAYLSMTLIGLSVNPEMSDSIGMMMTWTLRSMLILNMVFIIKKILHAFQLRLILWRNQLNKKMVKRKKEKAK